MQLPAGGPNFFEFGDDVLYEIHIDNNGDGRPDVTLPVPLPHRAAQRPDVPLQHRPDRVAGQPELEPAAVLLGDPGRRPRQAARCSPSKLPCPPCNVGPLSIPDYAKLAEDAVHKLKTGEKVFAGQRADGFFVDLGAIFDLGTLRPFQNSHAGRAEACSRTPARRSTPPTGSTCTASRSRCRCTYVRRDGKKKVRRPRPGAVIGVWTSASRRQVQVRHGDAERRRGRRPARAGLPAGQPAVQRGHRADGAEGPVEQPAADARTSGSPSSSSSPSWPQLLPVLYPDVFDNLAALEQGQDAARRPGGDPAHRHPGRAHRELPEQHRRRAGRHAAAEHRDPAGRGAEQVRRARRRPGRLPERPPGRRRRRVDLAAGRRRGHRCRWSTRTSRPDEAAAAGRAGAQRRRTSTAKLLDEFPYLGMPFDGFSESRGGVTEHDGPFSTLPDTSR